MFAPERFIRRRRFAVPLGQRALMTILWCLATAGVLAVAQFMSDGIAQEVVMVAGLSMVLTSVALLFLLVAEAVSPDKRSGA